MLQAYLKRYTLPAVTSPVAGHAGIATGPSAPPAVTEAATEAASEPRDATAHGARRVREDPDRLDTRMLYRLRR